ncbi:hypothetical protein [Amycolatopsis sp. NPDC004378]
MIEHFETVLFLAQIPNPGPSAPPGANEILGVVGNVKWAAGIALLVGFFAGLVVWAGGRWIDHHRAGRIGLIMMLCAIGGGLLYGIGWQLINHFAGSQ